MSGDLSLGSEVSLVGGEGVSERLGLSRSEESRLAVQGELGAVFLVELLDAGSLLEGVLDLLSVLLVDNGQVSRDSLSDELGLVRFLCTAWRMKEYYPTHTSDFPNSTIAKSGRPGSGVFGRWRVV